MEEWVNEQLMRQELKHLSESNLGLSDDFWYYMFNIADKQEIEGFLWFMKTKIEDEKE